MNTYRPTRGDGIGKHDSLSRLLWMFSVLKRDGELNYGPYFHRWGCSVRTWWRDVERLSIAGVRVRTNKMSHGQNPLFDRGGMKLSYVAFEDAA